jgi:hypothetical protein
MKPSKSFVDVKLKCECLIDQNIYNGDPVGHSCYNDAEIEFNGYLVCRECMRMLSGIEFRRVTMSPFPLGIDGQLKIIKGIFPGAELKK